jgi:hypothetical protein
MRNRELVCSRGIFPCGNSAGLEEKAKLIEDFVAEFNVA